MSSDSAQTVIIRRKTDESQHESEKPKPRRKVITLEGEPENIEFPVGALIAAMALLVSTGYYLFVYYGIDIK